MIELTVWWHVARNA